MQRSREVLAQRPPPPPTPAPAWRVRARMALAAFARQVLLRPARIGTLALLAGLISIVLVGAEGWWIVLGVTLFQAAACMLTVVWVDIPPARPLRQAERLPAGPWFALEEIPRQRRPRPDE